MNNTDLIHLIKHFMRNEHKAVEEVIDSPLSEVANLIKVLQSCQGKVVFIGVGKSGIIARKLAATFASTGTPSFFCSRYGSCTRRPWNGGERRCCYSYFKQW